MDEKYCNVCGSKLENNSNFCQDCGAEIIESKNNGFYQEENIENETLKKNVSQSINSKNKYKKRKFPIKVFIIIILIFIILLGIGYGICCLIALFSINTPPMPLNEEIENDIIQNKNYDTSNVVGIINLDYDMSEIVGTWYVTFKNYVSLDGETIGLYQSYSHVNFDKIDETNFIVTFDVKTAEINGETTDVGKKVFYGKLENNTISIEMNCEDYFLYTGTLYNVNFIPVVQSGKLSGKSESISNVILEGHTKTYRVITEFTQK